MNNTLANGFRILEFLSGTAQYHSVKEISDVFNLPRSHACRLLKTLKETGYIEQDNSRQYKISLKILCLSNACLKQIGIRARLRPFIDRLSRKLKQTVYLMIPVNNQPLIVDVAYPDGKCKDIGIDIGTINPIHTSASGKICAAYIPEKELDEFLDTISFSKSTDRTITDKKTFKKELGKIRMEKIAVTDSERQIGVAAAAGPVFNCEGGLACIIGAVLPSRKHSDKEWAFFKDEISEAALSASYALGYAFGAVKSFMKETTEATEE